MKDEERYSVGMNMIEPIVLVREVRVRDFKNLIHLNLIFRTDLYSYSFFFIFSFSTRKTVFFLRTHQRASQEHARLFAVEREKNNSSSLIIPNSTTSTGRQNNFRMDLK